MSAENLCELCGARGITSRLVPCQINLEEAILLCEDTECSFPLGTSRFGSFVIQRKAAEISNFKRRKTKKVQSTKSKIPTSAILEQEKKIEKSETFIQWQNEDALCWLDCVLNLLVHNITVQQLIETLKTPPSRVKKLLNVYKDAQDLIPSDINIAKELIKGIRHKLWTFLMPKMRCELGVNDSPVFALPLLLRENVVTREKCLQQYTWEFSCKACGFTEKTRQKKHLVTIPNMPEDFSLSSVCFQKKCTKCGTENQRSTLTYDKVPNIVLLHFVEGLKCPEYLGYQYDFLDKHYQVTQFIQYARNPDHFICWTKEHYGSRWMELDDLKSSICTWSDEFPRVPPSEVHILVCEQVGPGQTLVGDMNCMDVAVELDVETSAFIKNTHRVKPCRKQQQVKLDKIKDKENTKQELLNGNSPADLRSERFEKKPVEESKQYLDHRTETRSVELVSPCDKLNITLQEAIPTKCECKGSLQGSGCNDASDLSHSFMKLDVQLEDTNYEDSIILMNETREDELKNNDCSPDLLLPSLGICAPRLSTDQNYEDPLVSCIAQIQPSIVQEHLDGASMVSSLTTTKDNNSAEVMTETKTNTVCPMDILSSHQTCPLEEESIKTGQFSSDSMPSVSDCLMDTVSMNTCTSVSLNNIQPSSLDGQGDEVAVMENILSISTNFSSVGAGQQITRISERHVNKVPTPYVSKKRRSTSSQFQPYVPKKQRLATPSHPTAPLENSDAKCYIDKPDTVMKSSSLWQGVAEERGVTGALDDSQSDSGYSSPSSVSSCSSLISGLVTTQRIIDSTDDRIHELDATGKTSEPLIGKIGELGSELLSKDLENLCHKDEDVKLKDSKYFNTGILGVENEVDGDDSIVAELEALLPDCLVLSCRGDILSPIDKMMELGSDIALKPLPHKEDQFLMNLVL